MRVDVGKNLHSSTRSTRFLAKNGVFLRVNHAKNAPKSADFGLFRAVSVPLLMGLNTNFSGIKCGVFAKMSYLCKVFHIALTCWATLPNTLSNVAQHVVHGCPTWSTRYEVTAFLRVNSWKPHNKRTIWLSAINRPENWLNPWKSLPSHQIVNFTARWSC